MNNEQTKTLQENYDILMDIIAGFLNMRAVAWLTEQVENAKEKGDNHRLEYLIAAYADPEGDPAKISQRFVM